MEKTILKYLLFIIISYAVMYVAVWLHEIGHSIFYYKYGLKDSWIRVKVKPYIFFSTPGNVDVDAWSALSDKQYLAIAYAGIAMNAIWAGVAGATLACVDITNQYIALALWMFLSLHLGEIFSYLFAGSIYVVSDMQIISQAKPQLRIPNIIIGALFAVLYIYVLIIVPTNIKRFVIIWNVITVLSMCVGRIVFSISTRE